MIQKDQNTMDYSALTTGNGDPRHEVCIPHSIPHAWEQQFKGEGRGRNIHKDNTKK